jgi:hypothetical protein
MIDQNVLALRKSEDERICSFLRSIGADVESVFDLVNTRRTYPELIPSLLEILPTVQEIWMREGVVRALTVKEARGSAGPLLIGEFRRKDVPDLYRWTVGNALSVVATPDMFDELAELIKNVEFGTGRRMLPDALLRADKRRAESVLLDLVEDEEILPTVVRALGKLRSRAAIPRIRELAGHDWTLLRREARKALDKIGAA